uniref:Uncharacterized protein n=1 Tax=Romanomermis culicivorax TaxID=13658 RepID=A0A915IA98_ROMCU
MNQQKKNLIRNRPIQNLSIIL